MIAYLWISLALIDQVEADSPSYLQDSRLHTGNFYGDFDEARSFVSSSFSTRLFMGVNRLCFVSKNSTVLIKPSR